MKTTRHDVALASAANDRPIEIGTIAFDAPWAWLAAGWRDFWAAPTVSFVYGTAFAVVAALLLVGLAHRGAEALILPLAGGFMLLGPTLAVGLYETSRRIEAGEPVSLRLVLRAAGTSAGRLGFFGAMLALAYAIWLQLAFLLLMLFMGGNHLPPVSEFVPTLLFTTRGLGLLAAGTVVGALMALIVYSISAVCVPLLMTRSIDAVTASRISIKAVLRNPKPMMLWAALIAGFMSLGFATLLIGLVVAFPLIGYSTWHAFRDVIT